MTKQKELYKVAIVKDDSLPASISSIRRFGKKTDETILNKIELMIRDSLTRVLGDLEELIKPRIKITVKPNVTGPRNPEEVTTTDPRVVQALCRLLKKVEPTVVINVVDNPSLAHSGVPGLSAENAFMKTGIYDAATEGGADNVSLNIDVPGHSDSRTEVVKIDNPFVIDRVEIFKSILDADLIFNIPKMKTVIDELVSLGLKNWQGVLPTCRLMLSTDKTHMGRQNDLKGQQQAFHRADNPLKILDVYKALVQSEKRIITLVDAIWGMQGQGPWIGKPVKMDVIIAGTNCVAVDATTSRCMGIEPVEVNLIRCAHSHEMGSMAEGDIEILGESIPNVREFFERPSWNPIGLSNKVHIHAGGSCIGCLAHIRGALDSLVREEEQGNFSFNQMDDIHIVTGVDVSEVALKQIKRGRTYLVGDCCALKGLQGESSVRERVENYIDKDYKYCKGCAPVMAIIRLSEWIKEKTKRVP